MKREKIAQLEKINRLIRYWIIDMTTVAGSGHPTSSLSAVELTSTLFFNDIFRFDVHNAQNRHNDRMIFSKGHASPLFYALWTAAGVVDPTSLQDYRRFSSELEGHPTRRFAFTEAATGSLGQGLSIGVGMAIVQKYRDKTDARTYVLLGDSEMSEGQNWEAMQIASEYALDNLIAIVDVNRLGQRGETMVGHDLDVYAERARSFGWRTVIVDGHDIAQIARVYGDMIGTHQKPLMIIARTFKGKGISFLEDKFSWHGRVLTKEESAEAISQLGEIDFSVRGKIRVPCVEVSDHEEDLSKKCEKGAQALIEHNDDIATRDVYGVTLAALIDCDPKIIVLDAEVGNSTRADLVRERHSDRFFEMYIAEQNMVSVAVGMALRGYHPFVSSFAAFLTRAHDQIRMAQYNDVTMVITGSHAGVSIGEDGSSQMGLEDIAMMRAMCTTTILYPCDAISAQKIFCIAHMNKGITYVRTTREKTPTIYDDQTVFTIGGSHVVRRGASDRVTVIASGITVHEAVKAHKLLSSEHMDIRVIDLYGIKPIDVALLRKNIGDSMDVIIVEDHYRDGGIGDAVMAALCTSNIAIHHLAVDKIPHSGMPEELLQYEEIDYNAIITQVKKII